MNAEAPIPIETNPRWRRRINVLLRRHRLAPIVEILTIVVLLAIGIASYVFTSRRETADEYRKRTGSSAVPDPAGNHRVFRLTSGFAEHDEKLGSIASVDVRRETAPTRDEAEKLIQPAIWDVTVQALGDGDWRPSMNWLDVGE